MDFSLTQLFVVPSDNTLPTSGYPYELSVGQVGFFKADGTAATSANIDGEDYIYIAQGHEKNDLPTDKTDKIAKAKVISYTKATGSATAANEIWDVSDFSVKCGEDVSLTIDAHSFYLDTAFFNGLRRSVTVKAPCCDCDGDPCTDVDQEKIVDLLIEELQSDFSYNREAVNLVRFFDFLKIGSGNDTKLRISAKALDNAGQECDLAVNPHMYDRLWFRPFVTKGAPTNADFLVYDSCDVAGTTTLVQKSTFPVLTSEEVKSLEKDYYSYKVPSFKQLYRIPGFNPYFKSLAEDGEVYNQYTVTFRMLNNNTRWQDNAEQDERVILLVPNSVTSIETILTAYFGTPENTSGSHPTTTTTTSTSSTTTTSTTAVPFP